MPLLIHNQQKNAKAGSGDALSKPIPKSTGELAAEAFSNLWQRLFQSYVHFSQPGCEPFVRDAAPLHGAPRGSFDVAESRGLLWNTGFASSSTSTALIQHLYLCNEHFDVLSWLIAFCLIDRLQLHHYVRQRLGNMSLWKPSESSPPPFQLVKGDVAQVLFTVYTLAFKWHLDYTVSIKYLTNLLPHPSAARRAILRTTVADELLVLQVLDYNCAVSQYHLTQLMDHFLTPTERSYVLRAVQHR